MTQSSSARSVRSLDWSLDQLPGLDAQAQALLRDRGILTTLQLLKAAQTPPQKIQLAQIARVPVNAVVKWVALADLARVPDVGCVFCGLLLHAGIASVTQLAQTPPHRLTQQILRLQVSMMQRRDLCPSVNEVTRWVQQARSLSPVR